MNGRDRTCDDSRLRSLLSSDDWSEAPSAESRAAAEHVENCPRCQSQLNDLAAEASQWQEARQLLASDAADGRIRAEIDERTTSGVWLGTKSTMWTEAMAKQLLGPPSHPEMLGRLGRYEVERLIGSGGYGIVFKAFDTELNRPVAVKVLAPHLAGSGAARQRFAREARAAAAVVHEHVVAIHNVESDGAAPFLVMQFVAGDSLQARLDRQGPLALTEILRIAHQTAAGLAAAHAQGLVHRDVKPSNILLEQGIERALLTDFGLARAADDASLTHTGYLPGTPHYMSPEQARGESVDSTSDLFSLGSVIYAMCTGRPPFRADTSFGVLRRITDTDPRQIHEINPEIPAWLASLIDKLLAKQPGERFGSAAEVASLLEQCLAHVQQPASVPLPAACRVVQAQRRPARLIASIAAVVALLLAVSAAIYLTRPKTPSRLPASNTLPTAATADSPSELEWNAAADAIATLSDDIHNLESRATRLWDREPLPTRNNQDSAPPTSAELENMP